MRMTKPRHCCWHCRLISSKPIAQEVGIRHNVDPYKMTSFYWNYQSTFVKGSSRVEEVGLGRIGDTWPFVCCLEELIFRSFFALKKHIINTFSLNRRFVLVRTKKRPEAFYLSHLRLDIYEMFIFELIRFFEYFWKKKIYEKIKLTGFFFIKGITSKKLHFQFTKQWKIPKLSKN